MNSEETRLRTFVDWPANAAVDSARIAKAGFYFTGRGQEVQCFLCGAKVEEWNYGDQAMVRHRQVSPECPFVLNPSDTCNVPLLTASNSAEMLSSRRNSDSTVHGSPVVFRSRDVSFEVQTMAQRLATFDTWPIPGVVSPERLAQAGFYYLQQADVVIHLRIIDVGQVSAYRRLYRLMCLQVECVYCRGVIMKWEPGDDPDREHRLHFPNCNFYLRQDFNQGKLV